MLQNSSFYFYFRFIWEWTYSSSLMVFVPFGIWSVFFLMSTMNCWKGLAYSSWKIFTCFYRKVCIFIVWNGIQWMIWNLVFAHGVRIAFSLFAVPKFLYIVCFLRHCCWSMCPIAACFYLRVQSSKTDKLFSAHT